MIRVSGRNYVLSTLHSAYVFRIMETGHPEHLYYGPSLGDPDLLSGEALAHTADVLEERKEFAGGNMIEYDAEHPSLMPEDLRLEMSSYGKGDIREPFVEVIHEDGSFTSDFLFEKAEIRKEKTPVKTLPSSYYGEEESAEELVITMRDAQYDLRLELYYNVLKTATASHGEQN